MKGLSLERTGSPDCRCWGGPVRPSLGSWPRYFLRNGVQSASVATRKHSLAYVDGSKVRLGYRPVHLEPLTKDEDGGISLKKIAPKARVY